MRTCLLVRKKNLLGWRVSGLFFPPVLLTLVSDLTEVWFPRHIFVDLRLDLILKKIACQHSFQLGAINWSKNKLQPKCIKLFNFFHYLITMVTKRVCGYTFDYILYLKNGYIKTAGWWTWLDLTWLDTKITCLQLWLFPYLFISVALLQSLPGVNEMCVRFLFYLIVLNFTRFFLKYFNVHL